MRSRDNEWVRNSSRCSQTNSYTKHSQHCVDTTRNSFHPHHFRKRCRSDRQRLRGELGAAGRQRHRVHPGGVLDSREVAGAAQSDCTARQPGRLPVQPGSRAICPILSGRLQSRRPIPWNIAGAVSGPRTPCGHCDGFTGPRGRAGGTWASRACPCACNPCRECLRDRHGCEQNRGYSSNLGKSRLEWECVVMASAPIRSSTIVANAAAKSPIQFAVPLLPSPSEPPPAT